MRLSTTPRMRGVARRRLRRLDNISFSKHVPAGRS